MADDRRGTASVKDEIIARMKRFFAAEAATDESVSSKLPGRENGPADAYRHILWAAELTRRFGEPAARLILEAKEFSDEHGGWSSVDEKAREEDKTPPPSDAEIAAAVEMDKANNEIGIRIGREAKSWQEVMTAAQDTMDESARDGSGRDGGAVWLPDLQSKNPKDKNNEEIPLNWPDTDWTDQSNRQPYDYPYDDAPADGEQGESGRPDAPDDRSDAGERPQSFRTEGARKLFRAIAGDGEEDAFDLLRKPPERLTEDEVQRIGRTRIGLGDGDPARNNLFRHEEGFYRAIYGDGPQPRDETGRPLLPAPVRPVASRPASLRTADGTPLADARRRIAADLAADADRRDPAAAVRGLQERLNGLAASGREGFGETPPLRLDGLFGPKTRRRLDDVLMAGRPVAGPGPGIVPAPSRRGVPAVV